MDVAALRRRFGRFPNLYLRDRTESMPDLWEGEGEDTLTGVYFRMLHEMAGEDPRAELAAKISRKLLADGEVILP